MQPVGHAPARALRRGAALLVIPYVLALAAFAVAFGGPIDRLALAAGKAWFGGLLIAFGVLVPLGVVNYDPSGTDYGALSVRCARAVARATVPLSVGAGLAVVAWAFAPYWHPRDHDALTWAALAAAAVSVGLWLTLAIAGWPAALLPPVIREHGPRRLWDDIPDRIAYRQGPGKLARWLGDDR